MGLTPELLEWNKNVFGDLFKEKRKFLRRLVGIQRAQDKSNNKFLMDLNN